ncbi:MAG: outer membrane lipoprotein SlyB [Janthinobacterium sp.]|jgi:outer membrane lipoprotein SlyB
MKPTPTLAAIAVATSMLITGCSTYAPQQTTYPSSSQSQWQTQSQSQSQSEGYGTVESIQVTRVKPVSGGAGAVVGGLLGALLANQVGSGSGRTAATVAGAAGGAYVGNEVEKNRAQGRDAYQISIRLDNGDYRTIVQDDVNDLRVGNRVRVFEGRAYRY